MGRLTTSKVSNASKDANSSLIAPSHLCQSGLLRAWVRVRGSDELEGLAAKAKLGSVGPLNPV